jgi:small multidrug resistance family-3 protein
VHSIALYIATALLEIAGCFSFWAWLRLDRSPWLLLPGVLSLVAFAALLTRIEADFAGRAFAAYGGIYIAVALMWLVAVEGTVPDRWDVVGSTVCILGALIILLGPR